MGTATFIPASDRQMSFAKDLLATREYDINDEFIAFAVDLVEADALDKSNASKLISTLINAPKRAGARGVLQDALKTIPKSRYAIPTEMLVACDSSDKFHGDLVFIEVKEYMQTLYMRQLHGAPGRFNRSKLSQDSVKAIISIIAADPYKFTRIFGEHYTCCGSCGAELTDPKSRELMLGPECRKKFGF